MCIRDRARQKLLSLSGLQAWAYDAIKIGAFRNSRGDGFESVSYTHLRAHETVLDIVCRLLLEKKNQIMITCTSHALFIHIYVITLHILCTLTHR